MADQIKEKVHEGIKEAIKVVSKEIGEDRMGAQSRGLLDVFQEKIISRKLLVFCTATYLMWHGLDPDTWGLIAMCYIGGQSAIDMVKAWKWG